MITQQIELIAGVQPIDVDIEELPAGMYNLLVPEIAMQQKGKRFIKI